MTNKTKQKELHLMTQKKRSRGRPIGGNSPAIIREYWRIAQQSSRKTKKEKHK
jgi:hypothetical protein